MRNLNNIDGAERGGGNSATNAESSAPSSEQAAANWWEKFAEAVEDPRVSTYDFLKGSLLRKLELDGAQGFEDLLDKAEAKAIKEMIELADLRELRKTIKHLEKNKLFFDYKTRVAIQCARVLLDTYLDSKDEYEKDMAKRKASGQALPDEEEQQKEIQRIVEEKLANTEVAEQIEEMAQVLTGKDKEEIKATIEEATKQLSDESSLKKIAGDVVGISKKYMTLDNLVNIGVHALPLLTWQYRWAVAIVFGAYVSRMAVYHGYKAGRARLAGDNELAKEEGHKALTALKAAGGNVLAIGISPLVGKLPAKLAIWGGFAAGFIYNKTLELGQALLKKKEEIAPEGIKAATAQKAKGAWNWIKTTFNENLDALVALTAKAIKKERPNDYTETLETASKRVPATKVRTLAGNVWVVGKAAGRRLKRTFGLAADPYGARYEAVIEAAEETDNEPETNADSEMNGAFTNAANGEEAAPEQDDIETVPEIDIPPKQEPSRAGGPL